MKRLFFTFATAVALFTNTAAADYFRVFYYVEGKNDPCSAEDFRPFKYSTAAKTAVEAYRELIEEEPAAVYVTINNMGKEETGAEPTVEPSVKAPIAEGIDYSQEAGLPVEWGEDVIYK